MWKEQIKRTGTAINRGGTGVKEQRTTHTGIDVSGWWTERRGSGQQAFQPECCRTSPSSVGRYDSEAGSNNDEEQCESRRPAFGGRAGLVGDLGDLPRVVVQRPASAVG